MKIEELRKCIENSYFINDHGTITTPRWNAWDLFRDLLNLFEAIEKDATIIDDGSDPKGGWIGCDEEERVWDAFVAVRDKMEKL